MAWRNNLSRATIGVAFRFGQKAKNVEDFIVKHSVLIHTLNPTLPFAIRTYNEHPAELEITYDFPDSEKYDITNSTEEDILRILEEATKKGLEKKVFMRNQISLSPFIVDAELHNRFFVY